MNKIVYALLMLFWGLAADAQNAIWGSFYVKFQEPAKSFTYLKKQLKSNTDSRRIDSRILFPIKSNSSELSKYNMSRHAHSMHVGEALDNCFRIDFKNIDNERENEVLFEVLVREFGIDNVEKVYESTLLEYDTIPNDPLLHSHVITGGWHLNHIGFDKIYGRYWGSPDIKVAVIDNAVWGEHPDLNIKPQNQYFAYIEEEGSSAPPSNVSQDEECDKMSDCSSAVWSHGTHCAGLVAAISNNNEGVASFASGVTLLSARSADNNPKTMVRPYECILWALDKGARVLSLSWGNYNYSDVEGEIIENAVKQGVVVVAAAGNDGADRPIYPASYEGVISVGSVDSDNRRSSFSNYGDWVKICAPVASSKMKTGR